MPIEHLGHQDGILLQGLSLGDATLYRYSEAEIERPVQLSLQLPKEVGTDRGRSAGLLVSRASESTRCA